MKITMKDIEFLHTLYKMRCLSLNSTLKYFYPDKSYINSKIVPFRNAKLINIRKIDNVYYLEIAQKGIDTIQRFLNIPNEIYNIERNKYEKVMMNLSDVIIEDKYVKHQTSLNEFVLEYMRLYGEEVDYYDERFISGNTTILRPDGMIRLKNADLYLEQDMGTESRKQLMEKWYRYRRYLNNGYHGKRKLIILFIINCQNEKARDLLVRKTFLDSFDQLVSNNFEMYVGTKEEILEACFKRILVGEKDRNKEIKDLMSRFNYTTADGSGLKIKLDGVIYHYYLVKKTNGKTDYYCPNRNRIGRFQEFLCDMYDYSPMTVLSKIKFHHKNSKNFDIAYSNKSNARLIGYVIITRNIKEFYTHLKACNLIDVENVYVTTPARLKKFTLPKALLKIDPTGNVFSCQNYYYEASNLEGKIDDFGFDGMLLSE